MAPTIGVLNPATFTEHERRIAAAFADRQNRRLTLGEGLRREVAAMFGLSVDDLTGKSRRADITDARSLLSYMLRERGFQYAEIGRLLNRSYATIYYLEKRIARDYELQRLAETQLTVVAS